MRVEVKNLRHDVVNMLLKLMLILPVATVSVGRVFPSVNYVKNKLWNSILAWKTPKKDHGRP
jgi:hypothetical protein